MNFIRSNRNLTDEEIARHNFYALRNNRKAWADVKEGDTIKIKMVGLILSGTDKFLQMDNCPNGHTPHFHTLRGECALEKPAILQRHKNSRDQLESGNDISCTLHHNTSLDCQEA
jgi:hypothetical protein